MITLIISTRNSHKIAEIRAVLSEGFQYRALNDFPAAPAVIEDAETFAGNAAKKALGLAGFLASHPEAREAGRLPLSLSEIFCLADDSGLEVDALGGAPGVRSARFAAPEEHSGNSSDRANNEKLLRLMQGLPDAQRTGRFRCCLALVPVVVKDAVLASPVCLADEGELRLELFEGACEGRIERGPRGSHGFGYDPLFVPAGFDQSFAELGEDVKNRISHRAKALQQLAGRLGRL